MVCQGALSLADLVVTALPLVTRHSTWIWMVLSGRGGVVVVGSDGSRFSAEVCSVTCILDDLFCFAVLFCFDSVWSVYLYIGNVLEMYWIMYWMKWSSHFVYIEYYVSSLWVCTHTHKPTNFDTCIGYGR